MTVLPPPAEPGDRVAVLSPASGGPSRYPHVHERGLSVLRNRFEVEPVEFPTARRSDEWLRANPEARARDVERAFRDPDVAAVLTTIGGNDQVRILDHLDPDVLAAHPTRFFGISDNTHLHSLLFEAGVVSFYGGTTMTDLALAGGPFEHTLAYLRRALFEESLEELDPAPEFSDHDVDWADPAYHERAVEREPNPGWEWRGGDAHAKGPVWGGCLEVLGTVLAADLAAPDPDSLSGGVLFVETSEERPSAAEVWRHCLGLGERGLLAAVDAVLVGRPKARGHREDPGPEARAAYRQEQYDTVARAVALYAPETPVVCGVDVGHTHPTTPLPVGGTGVVDPEAGRIAFPGPATGKPT